MARQHEEAPKADQKPTSATLHLWGGKPGVTTMKVTLRSPRYAKNGEENEENLAGLSKKQREKRETRKRTRQGC